MSVRYVKCIGQYPDGGGELCRYATPQRCSRFGNELLDEDGFVWAVQDEYGDWVSPSMRRLGIKSVVKVEADENEN